MALNRPVSESFYEAAHDWVTLDATARLMEESKSSIFSQKCIELGDLPVNKAEQIVRASPEWHACLQRMVDAKTKANKAKIEIEYWKMKAQEAMSDQANERMLSRGNAA